MEKIPYHNPVLLTDAIDGLVTDKSATYVDATFGGGGHAREILQRLDEHGRLIAFDQDSASQKNLIDDKRFTFVSANFRHLKKFLLYHHSFPVQGILADLGVSSHQFDTPDRGFSYRYDGRLDMRMNTDKNISANDIINTYSEQQLAKLFYTYGELSLGGKIASLIVKERNLQPIETTAQLATMVTKLLPRGKENKALSQLFQAIRIEVNDECGALQEMLLQSLDALMPTGRLAVISYHSIEDRMVKNFMKSGNFLGVIEKDFFGNPLTPFHLITRKAIIPSETEMELNQRSRSAKLRVAEKKTTPTNQTKNHGINQ